MKLYTLFALSATVLFAHQVLAITPEESSEQVSLAEPSSLTLLAEPKTPEPFSGQDVKGQDDTIETELIKSLGWSSKDSAILTSFLTAIDQMGTIVGERAQQGLDQATVDMLAEFQIHARQLMADAGYEFRQDGDNRILVRTKPHEEALPDLVEKMVLGLVDLLNRLRESAKKSPIMAVVLNLVTDLLKSLGKYLEKLLTNHKSR